MIKNITNLSNNSLQLAPGGNTNLWTKKREIRTLVQGMPDWKNYKKRFYPSEYFGVAWQQLSQGRCSQNEVWISCSAVTEVKRVWLFCLSFVKADDPLSISLFEFNRLLNHVRWQLSNILKIQYFTVLELFSTESFHLLPVCGFPCSLVSVLPVKDTWD